MAEANAAEDDDDEGFGDFTFVVSHNNSSNTNKQILDSSIQINNDDEWGDFVEYPVISNSNLVESSSSSDKISNARWVKPQGALPLSLFGDDEEEAETEAKEEVPDPFGSNVHSAVGINPIMANLHGFHSNSSPPPQSAVVTSFNFINSDPILLNPKSVLVGAHNLISSSKIDLHSASNGGVTSDNGLNSSLNSVSVDQESDDDDDQGWDFKDAYSQPKLLFVNDKLFSEKTKHDGANGSSDLVAAVNEVGGESYKVDNGFDLKTSNAAQNGLVSNSYFQAKWKNTDNGLNTHSPAGAADSNDYFGEFEAAFSEAGSTKKMQEFSGEAPVSYNGSQGLVDLFAAANGISDKSHNKENGFQFKPNIAIQNGFTSESYLGIEWKAAENVFATSNGISDKSHNEDGFEFKPNIAFQNGFTSESYLGIEWKGAENGLKSHPLSTALDKNVGKNESVFVEDSSKQKGNEVTVESRKGAVPLSVFGIEEPDADDSLDIGHEFVFQPPSNARKVMSQSPNLSINDILSNLYSQAEPVNSTENGLHSAASVSDINLVGDDDDDFDDGPWEFKDAVPESRVENHISLPSLAAANQNFSTIGKLNDFVDFYSKLKDELSCVLRFHLGSLKKARSDAALSAQEGEVATIDGDIQGALEELHQMITLSEQSHSDDGPERDFCLKAYLETMQDPSFQALDSEYKLSSRLLSAESDVRTAIELIKHSTTMLNILTLVSNGEQSNYILTWSKMISVSAQELKHGTWIWKQSLEKNVQNEILSESQGKQFILALGEIYKAVVVLGVSAQFYKPWILLNSVDLTGIYSLLEECHTLWLVSGLEEAIRNISDPIGTNYKEDIKSLLESIKHIHNIDALALANRVFAGQESICRLSLLTPELMPDMKLVDWNGEKYFLTLANLWANLISCDPPTLPCLHVAQCGGISSVELK